MSQTIEERIRKLKQIAFELYQQGNYTQAVICTQQSLDLAQTLWGNQHLNVAAIMHNLAFLHNVQGNYTEALSLFKQALELRQRLLGNEHPDVVDSLNNLAIIYQNQGCYSDAEIFLKQVLDLDRHLWGDEHLNVATTLNNLASLYYDQGRYSDAEPLFQQALELRQRLSGNEHPDVAITLNNLANLYYDQGSYNKAESLFQQALNLTRCLWGNEHPNVAAIMNNLANVYQDQGRYNDAENLLKQVLNLARHFWGNEHPNVATTLNNLGELYKKQGRYNEAESFYEQALNLRLHLLGNEHPQIALSLNNLADLYCKQGHYSNAELFLKQSLNLTLGLLGNEHPQVAVSLNTLANLYQNQGRYNEAESLYEQALNLMQRLLGNEHPDIIVGLNNLAKLLAATNKIAEALTRMMLASQIEDMRISQVFSTSSENDRLAYLQTIRGNLDSFLSLVYKHLFNSVEAVQAGLDLVLKRKALTASALAAQNQALYSGRYPHLRSEFWQLRSLGEQIVHFTFSLPKSDELTTYKQHFTQLQAQYEELQRRLASQVPEIKLQEQLQTANHHAVALELPESTTLVEFVLFNVLNFHAVPANGESRWQPARYQAFVLPAKQPDKVQMIDLGEVEHIDRLIRIFRSEASLEDYKAGDSLGMVKKKTAPVSKLKTFKYNPEPGIKLRELIFDPIRTVLGESKHLLISPDGELNLIPFQILPIDETGKQLLIDEYTISYLSVGRDVLRSKIQPTRPTSKPLVIADPDFNLNTKQEKHIASMSGNAELLNSLPGKGFNRAPGTRFLGEAIAQKLQVTPYLDAEAVESHVTSSQSPSILLIATHGFFLPDLPQETPLQESNLFGSDRFSTTKVENPMLRSGLALAGANIWLSGGTLPEKAGKGFLFAQDVAALDLWANELTVLSACNTAIGHVKIGEGVFGLRRAFAVAGTKTLVMSLWPVPDKATALLTERFFDNLARGFGRCNALLESQNYIRTITVRELRKTKLGCEVLEELLTQYHLFCQE